MLIRLVGWQCCCMVLGFERHWDECSCTGIFETKQEGTTVYRILACRTTLVLCFCFCVLKIIIALWSRCGTPYFGCLVYGRHFSEYAKLDYTCRIYDPFVHGSQVETGTTRIIQECIYFGTSWTRCGLWTTHINDALVDFIFVFGDNLADSLILRGKNNPPLQMIRCVSLERKSIEHYCSLVDILAKREHLTSCTMYGQLTKTRVVRWCMHLENGSN